MENSFVTLKEIFEQSSAVNFRIADSSDFSGALRDDQEHVLLSALDVFEKAESGNFEALDEDFLSFDVYRNTKDHDDYRVEACVAVGGPTVIITCASDAQAVVRSSWGADFIELEDDGSGLTEHMRELAEME